MNRRPELVAGEEYRWTRDRAFVSCPICCVGVLVDIEALFDRSRKEAFMHPHCAEEWARLKDKGRHERKT